MNTSQPLQIPLMAAAWNLPRTLQLKSQLEIVQKEKSELRIHRATDELGPSHLAPNQGKVVLMASLHNMV